jgi:hypothetical protein
MSGPAAAVTAPRNSRLRSSSPKSATVALQSIAPPQRRIAPPSVQVLRTRSASTPNGSVASAATSDVTVTSRPMSVLEMCRPLRRGVAAAPTVAVSAPFSARTAARTATTRVRSAPPRVASRRRRSDRQALPVTAAASTPVELPARVLG